MAIRKRSTGNKNVGKEILIEILRVSVSVVISFSFTHLIFFIPDDLLLH